jgi:hypothetical protein
MWKNAFISYTTLFRSRLGIIIPILQIIGSRTHHSENLIRKVKEIFFEKIPVNCKDKDWGLVKVYLTEKGYISKRPQVSGRFKNISYCEDGRKIKLLKDSFELQEINITRLDRWFSQPYMLSTIGVPTEDNLHEYLEMCLNFRVVNRSFKSLRVGNTIQKILSQASDEKYFEPNISNLKPYFLKILLESDYFIILALLKKINTSSTEFSRNDIVLEFADIVQDALKICESVVKNQDINRDMKKFFKLIKETKEKSKKKENSSGPGVLEHRVTPRLEWLVDLGVLDKTGVKRNSFNYKSTEVLPNLVILLEKVLTDSSKLMEAVLCVGEIDSTSDGNFEDLISAYRIISGGIGSVSIDDLIMTACINSRSAAPRNFRQILMERKNDKGIRFTGGRFSRKAEFVWFDKNIYN